MHGETLKSLHIFALYVNFHVIEMATNMMHYDDNYEHSSPSLDLAICSMQI